MALTVLEGLEEWTDLLIATTGGAAALAGLVTVAVAANIGEILKFAWLPSRAAASIGLLVLVLVVSIAGLMKPQSLLWFGLETVAFAVVTWFLTAQAIRARIVMRRDVRLPRWHLVQELASYQIAVVPFIVGGVLLAMGNTDGMYWVAAGIIAAIVLSMSITWVLLIEILR
jgi:modulator of FtsH protease